MKLCTLQGFDNRCMIYNGKEKRRRRELNRLKKETISQVVRSPDGEERVASHKRGGRCRACDVRRRDHLLLHMHCTRMDAYACISVQALCFSLGVARIRAWPLPV